MKMKNIDIEKLNLTLELLVKNNKCTKCAWNNTSGCGNRIETRCIKSKKYWINHLSNVDEKEYNATIELVLNGSYEY